MVNIWLMMVIIGLMMVNNYNWLVVEPYPSEKYDFVSWEDEIPNWMEKQNFPNHQPAMENEGVLKR